MDFSDHATQQEELMRELALKRAANHAPALPAVGACHCARPACLMGIASAIAIAGTILRERIGLNDAEASAAMIKVDIQGVEAVNAHLTGMSKHVSFAASKALNATGKAVA